MQPPSRPNNVGADERNRPTAVVRAAFSDYRDDQPSNPVIPDSRASLEASRSGSPMACGRAGFHRRDGVSPQIGRKRADRRVRRPTYVHSSLAVLSRSRQPPHRRRRLSAPPVTRHPPIRSWLRSLSRYDRTNMVESFQKPVWPPGLAADGWGSAGRSGRGPRRRRNSETFTIPFLQDSAFFWRLRPHRLG